MVGVGRGLGLLFAFAAGAQEPAPPTGPEKSMLLKTLRESIGKRYSHRDRRGLDWDKLFAEAGPGIEGATSRAGLVQAIVKLLAPAEDPHLALVVDGRWVMTDLRKPEPNVSVEVLKKRVTDWKHGPCISLGRVGDATYVLLNGLEKGRCDGLPGAWAKLWPLLAETPGLLIDLRGNQGGNEVFAQAIAGHFIEKPVPYVQSETIDPAAPSGFAPAVVRTLQPAAGVTPYRKPVVVLMGPLNGSSAEAFLLMFRAAGAVLVGGRSRGTSANPQPVELCPGLTLMVPSWRARLLDGTPLEGVGIAPDLEIPHVEGEDKVLDAGLAELAKRRKP